jgi:hypothetical protein
VKQFSSAAEDPGIGASNVSSAERSRNVQPIFRYVNLGSLASVHWPLAYSRRCVRSVCPYAGEVFETISHHGSRGEELEVYEGTCMKQNEAQ